MAIATKVCWETDIEKAIKSAEKTHQAVLFFFHSHQCNGCKKTLAETMNDERVVEGIGYHVVPGLFEINEIPDLAEEYKVEWTPTFIIADDTGKELYRWVGYLPAYDFLAQLYLGLGKAAFAEGKYEVAEHRFNYVLASYEDSTYAAEARYWLGVAEYKRTQDESALTRTNHDLALLYPDSIWAEKASVWTG